MRPGGGPLPLEERVCICGEGIQTERHVVEVCSLSHSVRLRYRIGSLEQLFSGSFSSEVLCQIIHNILNLYK